MTDVDALRPEHVIRHRWFREYRARVVGVTGSRVDVVLTSPPERAGDRVPLDRGDVATSWDRLVLRSDAGSGS